MIYSFFYGLKQFKHFATTKEVGEKKQEKKKRKEKKKAIIIRH